MLIYTSLIVAAGSVVACHTHHNARDPISTIVARDVQSATGNEYVSQIVAPVNATGKGWSAAYEKAVTFVNQLTIAELTNITTGYGILGRCVGGTGQVPRLGFPGICLNDAPSGIRFANGNSVFGVGMNAAMTWDAELMYRQGVEMAEEFRGKGVNVALGPMMNLARAPAAGRNWEGAGADPYLVGVHSRETIKGMQSTGVMACAKHFIANEQEHFRGGSQSPASSSNIDDRTMNEIYLWPFAESVRAGVASVMCAYQEVNRTHACENSATMNGLLKTQLDFQGFVVSDWAAVTSGPPTILGGTDMNMPGFIAYGNDNQPNPSTATNGFFGANIARYVNESSVPLSRIQDMAIRIMTPYYHFGQDEESSYPALNFNQLLHPITQNLVQDDPSEENVNVQGDHARLIRTVGSASSVLLKNKNSILPLSSQGPKSRKRIGVFGSDSRNAPKGPNGCVDRGCNDGTLALGWGSGTSNFPYLIAPLDAITTHLSDSPTTVQSVTDDFDYVKIARVASESDICLVFANSDSGEGYLTVDGNAGDRNNLSLWHGGDMLIRTVADGCKDTVVIIHAPGQVDMEQWIELDAIKGVIFAGMPGQESGNSIVDVLFGLVNPSARLPFTIAKLRSDYSADVVYTTPDGTLAPQIPYTEKLQIDYRHFDAQNIVPRFEFGYGLSYTRFSYSAARLVIVAPSRNGPSVLLPGGMSHLFDTAISVSFDIRNAGKVDGNEVSQVYIGFPASAGEPPKVLRGFNRSFIKTRQSTKVTINLNNKEISTWDVVNQAWSIPEGQFIVYIGASSRDVKLTIDFAYDGGVLSTSAAKPPRPKGPHRPQGGPKAHRKPGYQGPKV